MNRILVVDDNPVSRELIREVLDAPGRQIIEAAHGGEALEKMGEAAPDLVLLDIQMPVLDGYEVLARMKQDARLAGVRVVALTAYAMQSDRQRALAAGFDAYVSKPIEGAALRKQVQALLEPESE